MDLLTEISTIEDVAINKAVQILQNMKCQFAIITPNGKKMGNLEVNDSKKRPLKYAMGTLKNYYFPYVKDIGIGNSVLIPNGEFEPEHLQSSLSAWCSTNWGKGTYATRIIDRGVEVVRFL